MTEFARARPAVPISELVAELGPDDVNEIQVIAALRAEAEREDARLHYSRDLLARAIVEAFPGGWPTRLEGDTLFTIGEALTFWRTQLPDDLQGGAWSVIRGLIDNPPLPGWRPSGADDPFIAGIVPDSGT